MGLLISNFKRNRLILILVIKVLVSRGILVRDEYIHSIEVEEMKAYLRNKFELDHRPEAIIKGSDRVSVGIINFARVRQHIIPKNLAVIVIIDVSFAIFVLILGMSEKLYFGHVLVFIVLV